MFPSLNRTIETELNQAIAKVIRETDFTLGREVHLFEGRCDRQRTGGARPLV